MTLTIHTEEDTQRQMAMTIELDEARVMKAMRDKARELSRDYNFPGFRPGRAPYQVVARRLGEDALRAEAVEALVQPVFEEAIDQLEEQGIEMYGTPQLDDIDIENKPILLKFTLPLQPIVKLGDYRTWRKEVEPVEIKDEAVDEALESIRESHQELETVDRPAEMGDVVVLSGKGVFLTPLTASAEGTTFDDTVADEATDEQTESKAEAEVAEETAVVDEAETAAMESSTTAEDGDDTGAANEDGGTEEEDILFENERMELLLDSKRLFPGTPFADEIVGMAVGDEKSFSFTFPEDYEEEDDMAGREATFTVTLLEVKQRELPPLDDELAKLAGNYETLDELRASTRENLERSARDEHRNTMIEEMVDQLLEEAEMIYPPAAVEMIIDDMVGDFQRQLQGMGWQMQDYLQLQGLTQDSIRDDFRQSAETRLRRQLALRQFVLDEKLRVEAADIDAIIDERVSRFDNEELRDGMRNFYQSGRGFEAISSEALGNKTYERIEAILSGNAPDLATLELETKANAASDELNEEE